MKIVIIEDEVRTAEDLKQSLLKLRPDIHVLSILHSVEEAIEFFKSLPVVDLIFSDIELEDGLSFEVFKAVNITTPVIFCTAYDEYALDAFKANGIEYILKPFSEEILKCSLLKLESLRDSLNKDLLRQFKATSEVLDAYKNKTAKTLLVRYRNQLIPIAFDRISVIFIENDITYIYTEQNQMYSISHTLDDMEGKAGENFFRVNRQFLINRNSVKETHHVLYRKLRIIFHFKFDREVLVSKEKTSKFLRFLSQ